MNGCKREILENESLMKDVVDKIVSGLNMTVVKKMSHYYGPGVSVVYLLAESHVSIHTWPELNFADLDIVSCKGNSDVLKGLDIAVKMLKPKRVDKHLMEYSH